MNQANVQGGGLKSHDLFKKIISPVNLFAAWREFKRGKLKKQDVFALTDNLEESIFNLHQELLESRYRHGPYTSFFLYDPKRRHIHKASARDRLLHHAIHRRLAPIFDSSFIFDSYSSKPNKGIHKAHQRFRQFAWKLSRNNTRIVWILKCDIKKFFDSIDHGTLLQLLSQKVKDRTALNLLAEIIDSFTKSPGRGLPLGNLTSQLFANIYLDPLDQFIKRELQIKHYLRYADDSVVLAPDPQKLKGLVQILADFLHQKLKLELHPSKVTLTKWHQGLDFLGYVFFPSHQLLRAKTKRRMLKKVSKQSGVQVIASYLGLLKHCRGRGIKTQLDFKTRI